MTADLDGDLADLTFTSNCSRLSSQGWNIASDWIECKMLTGKPNQAAKSWFLAS